MTPILTVSAEKALEGARTLVQVELGDARWRELVASDPLALPFHEPAWAGSIAECYGFTAFGLALAGDDGRLSAGLPVIETSIPLLGRRKWVSLPFSDVCPPIVAAAGSGDAACTLLIEAVDEARRRAGVSRLEVRAPVHAEGARLQPVAVMHVLELGSDPEALQREFRSSTRQGIRAAEREGVTVRRDDSREAVSQVFYALHVRTRRRLGVPVQERRFFDLLWERVIAPGNGFVLLAELAGRTIAAAVFLTSAAGVTYKYGASDERFWGARPNNALFWHAIRWAIEHEHRTLDFGRTDLDAEGLRRFKSSWGAVESPLVHSTFGDVAREPSHPGHGRAGKLAAEVIRRSPLFVCRATGRLMYRYAA